MRPHALLPSLALLALLGMPRAARALPATPPEFGGQVDYVIVTDDPLAAAFQPLADWKTASGVRALVHTLGAIRADYPAGRDDAERVRLFLQDAHATWGTQWALLGGDAGVMPVREASTTFFGGALLTSDLYFACLDGDWNADGDALWGEGNSASGPGDDADLSPDLWVGRAPVRDTSEVRRFVNKTIACAKTPAGDYEDRLLMTAEILGGTDGAQITEGVLPYAALHPAIQVERRYTSWSDPAWAPGALPLSRAAVLADMNAGENLVFEVDAASDSALGMNDGTITRADAFALTNEGRPFHLVGMHTNLNAFEGSSIGEAMVRAAGGAVTSVGPSTGTFVTTSQAVNNEFFRLLWSDSVNAVGEASGRAILPWVPFATFDGVTRWTLQTQLLLGDPELRIWTGPVRTATVFAPGELAGGQTSFDVAVLLLADPLAGARVTAWQSGRAWGSALTDADGLAHLAVQPLEGGWLTLTVTAWDTRPDVEIIPISPSTAVEAPAAPGSLRLGCPAPNPARGEVSIPWALPRGQGDAAATLAVLDPAGRRVRTLLRGTAIGAAGEVRWDLRDEGGSRVPPGLYLLRLGAAGDVVTRRVLVVR